MKLQRLEWQPYFNVLAARMRLGGWEVRILDEPPQNVDAMATVVCWHGRYVATIRLADSFLNETDTEQRYVAVHELVHCYHAHADELLEDTMGAKEKAAWTLAVEYGVDAIASTIAQFMPLPAEILKPEAA